MPAEERPAGCEERCPGCRHRDFSAEESAKRKNEWLVAELGLWKERLQPIRVPSERWGYRRKSLLHARFGEGAWRFGMIRRRGREEEFVPIPQCPLHDPQMNERLSLLASLLPAGFPLAFVLVSGRAYTLVLKARRQTEWLERMKSWENSFSGCSLFVNWHPGAGRRAVDTKRNECVFGPAWLEESGLVHGPTAFRQQLPEMEEAALGMAEAFLEGAGLRVAVDLYSGLGASLRLWERRGWEAVGVELSGESVAAARQNAPGMLLLRGRVEHRLGQVDEFLKEREFVLYTNPPRSGHGEGVVEWALARKPKRIAYLSCHPRSLAGDLNRLSKGFAVVSLQPLDFFPQTDHAETLALLERR